MTTGPDNLYQLCVSLREAIVDGFAADGVTLPPRREITGVDAVGECDKLVIEWSRVSAGVPGGVEQAVRVNRSLTRSAVITVYLFRCVWTPSGEALEVLESPTVEELDADARVIMTDAYELHRVIPRATIAGAFQGSCSGLSMGPVTRIPADGGISGSMVELTAELS